MMCMSNSSIFSYDPSFPISYCHTMEVITLEYMSKKLFTKLELTTPHSHAETTVSFILDGILSACAGRLMEKEIRQLSKQMLTKEVMYREVNSFAQAFPRRPADHPLPEDAPQNMQVREGARPFSAKIERTFKPARNSSKKSIYVKRGSSRSSHKYSVCQSVKSKQPKRYGNFRPNNDRFFPLPGQENQDDEAQEAFIDSLREKKAQQLAYQRSKENFLKASAEQGERYPKLNKKFLQTMGSKAYYYNKNGETVELAHQPTSHHNKLQKKAISNRISARQEHTKRSNEVRSELIVEYQQKENFFKRTREGFEIEARPPVLFYKSEQCKYQIIA